MSVVKSRRASAPVVAAMLFVTMVTPVAAKHKGVSSHVTTGGLRLTVSVASGMAPQGSLILVSTTIANVSRTGVTLVPWCVSGFAYPTVKNTQGGTTYPPAFQPLYRPPSCTFHPNRELDTLPPHRQITIRRYVVMRGHVIQSYVRTATFGKKSTSEHLLRSAPLRLTLTPATPRPQITFSSSTTGRVTASVSGSNLVFQAEAKCRLGDVNTQLRWAPTNGTIQAPCPDVLAWRVSVASPGSSAAVKTFEKPVQG